MFKLVYFVPDTHLEQTKLAVFEAGGGRIGDYDRCAWQCKGQGQFRPLAGSDPFLGKQGELEVVVEYRVELVCGDDYITGVIEALQQAHPYEEPAYDVMRLEAI